MVLRILMVASGVLGYTVGHRQGLTVVGFDADAEQLVEVVESKRPVWMLK